MVEQLHSLLLSSALLRLFLIISLGYVVGKIRIFGVSLNVAAILFVGLGFGMWDAEGFRLPEEIPILGLIFFVYSIGIQSGPAFFGLFRKRGLADSLLVITVLSAAFVATRLIGQALGLSRELIAGGYSGALTNTAALAAVTETVFEQSVAGGLSAGEAMIKAGIPTTAYGVAYPFGVLGSILAMRALAYYAGEMLEREKQEYRSEKKTGPALETGQFSLENPELAGKKFSELSLPEKTGMVFTRMEHHGFTSLINDESVFHLGDQIFGVGPAGCLIRAREVVGREMPASLAVAAQIEHRDLVMTNRRLAGKTLAEIRGSLGYGALISRLKRGYTVLPLDPDVRLQYGDKLRIVCYANNVEDVSASLGDQLQDLAEGDFLSIALGIILGILVGMIPLPLPTGGSLKLGFAGGPLLIAILLGRLGRTGPVIWTMPINTGLTIRQLGIYLFMAGIGIRAGGSFLVVLQNDGWKLLLLGATATLVTAFLTIILGRLFLKLETIPLLGLMSGIQGQPACLAFAETLAENRAPNIYYATIQPVSMLTKIILVQVLFLPG
jgi:putative transport protein